MKKRVAIFMHGGISGGFGAQGFPGIVLLVLGLSQHFDVTIYSLAFSKESTLSNFKIYSPPEGLKIKFLRWFWLLGIFILHHIKKQYDRLFSFWGYPMGFLVTIIGKLFNTSSLIYLLGAETANVREISYGHLRKPSSRKMVLWTCRHVTTLIAVSSLQVKTLNRYGLKRKVHVIPFGVDKKLFYPIFKKVELPLKMVHVANLTLVKDQITLIKAFQVVKRKLPARLRIVGPDYLDGALQRFVKQSGLEEHVEFMGPVLHKEILHLYHWADLCILTSLSEGQNTALTEAMMCGVLPVSTLVGIMDHELGSRIGIVADCKDYESLGNQIIDLFRQPPLWEQKRLAAFTWAKTYDLEWTIIQLETLICHG